MRKEFAGIEGTRLRFDVYFVKRQVLSGSNTVLRMEFIERDEACDWLPLQAQACDTL